MILHISHFLWSLLIFCNQSQFFQMCPSKTSKFSHKTAFFQKHAIFLSLISWRSMSSVCTSKLRVLHSNRRCLGFCLDWEHFRTPICHCRFLCCPWLRLSCICIARFRMLCDRGSVVSGCESKDKLKTWMLKVSFARTADASFYLIWLHQWYICHEELSSWLIFLEHPWFHH